MNVHVMRALLCHRGHAGMLAAPLGQVVVAEVHAGSLRQGEQALDRGVQRLGIATGEITTGGAVVRHKQRIADKRSIADHIAQAGRGMPRGMQHLRRQAADHKTLAVGEQSVELATIGGEPGLGVEQPAEGVLHLGDLRTNGQLATQHVLQVVGGG